MCERAVWARSSNINFKRLTLEYRWQSVQRIEKQKQKRDWTRRRRAGVLIWTKAEFPWALPAPIGISRKLSLGGDSGCSKRLRQPSTSGSAKRLPPLSSKLRSLFPHDFAPKCDSALSQSSPSDVGPGPSGDCDRARGGKRRKATITTSSSFRASMSADVFRAPCMTGVTGPVLELRGRLQRSASFVLKIK